MPRKPPVYSLFRLTADVPIDRDRRHKEEWAELGFIAAGTEVVVAHYPDQDIVEDPDDREHWELRPDLRNGSGTWRGVFWHPQRPRPKADDLGWRLMDVAEPIHGGYRLSFLRGVGSDPNDRYSNIEANVLRVLYKMGRITEGDLAAARAYREDTP